jgi:hypothetical protein
LICSKPLEYDRLYSTRVLAEDDEILDDLNALQQLEEEGRAVSP